MEEPSRVTQQLSEVTASILRKAGESVSWDVLQPHYQHDSISLRKANLHEGLTDMQTVKNKHYSLELAVFCKVCSCQSSGCFLRRVFPGFPLKRDPVGTLSSHTDLFHLFIPLGTPAGFSCSLGPNTILRSASSALGQWNLPKSASSPWSFFLISWQSAISR